MITALLVALSFNYPQAAHNVRFVAHQIKHHGGCIVKTLRPCKKDH